MPPQTTHVQNQRDPQRHLGFMLRRAQQRHLALWTQEVSAQVTGIQYSVLAVLDRLPKISQRELGEELDLERSTINDLVGRLEKSGLIRRSDDEVDRRRKVLEITAAGHGVLRELQPRVELLQTVLAGDLTGAEVSELKRLVAVLLRE
ncbi:MAG: MarR family transcriptional regulator [Actinobacteria bacterium]|jgi:DNA-binding MarR family transcriptional regulator|uniref:Unannotated protein n=1 Tax=freshwater metagenome TaxID=449393 RepID=A0A6J7FS43_9ZZZZ|nr:MarR family transcriptional regulator [Actinomycetota bacterium]